MNRRFFSRLLLAVIALGFSNGLFATQPEQRNIWQLVGDDALTYKILTEAGIPPQLTEEQKRILEESWGRRIVAKYQGIPKNPLDLSGSNLSGKFLMQSLILENTINLVTKLNFPRFSDRPFLTEIVARNCSIAEEVQHPEELFNVTAPHLKLLDLRGTGVSLENIRHIASNCPELIAVFLDQNLLNSEAFIRQVLMEHCHDLLYLRFGNEPVIDIAKLRTNALIPV